jgi:hypothetical protein
MAKHTMESLVDGFLRSYDLDGRNDYSNMVEYLKQKKLKTAHANVWRLVNLAKKLAGDDLEELELEE